MISDSLKVGGIYRHYKNKDYRVLYVALHSETLEKMVVYQALYDDPEFGAHCIWVRPLSMFHEQVEIGGKKISRFRYIEE